MCDKKEKQLELDKRYLRMAAVWAENSYCKRRQVGALIVKDQMIISDGYNGRHPVSRMFAKTRTMLPNLTFCMRKPMPLRKWPLRPTAAKVQRSTSPPPLASNVPSSSSSLGSSGWYTLKNIGWKMVATYYVAPVLL